MGWPRPFVSYDNLMVLVRCLIFCILGQGHWTNTEVKFCSARFPFSIGSRMPGDGLGPILVQLASTPTPTFTSTRTYAHARDGRDHSQVVGAGGRLPAVS